MHLGADIFVSFYTALAGRLALDQELFRRPKSVVNKGNVKQLRWQLKQQPDKNGNVGAADATAAEWRQLHGGGCSGSCRNSCRGSCSGSSLSDDDHVVTKWNTDKP